MTGQEQRRSDLKPVNPNVPPLKGTHLPERGQEATQKLDPPPPKPDMGRYQGRGFRPQNVW